MGFDDYDGNANQDAEVDTAESVNADAETTEETPAAPANEGEVRVGRSGHDAAPDQEEDE